MLKQKLSDLQAKALEMIIERLALAEDELEFIGRIIRLEQDETSEVRSVSYVEAIPRTFHLYPAQALNQQQWLELLQLHGFPQPTTVQDHHIEYHIGQRTYTIYFEDKVDHGKKII